jgi:putative peptidoglycan lipid II flippase
MAPRALGQGAVELNHLVNVMLASGLSAGSFSALNYGRLMMLLPQGVIAQSVAIAAFPTFSALFARGERDELRSVMVTTLRSVLFLTLPAAVGLIWLRKPLVSAIFERGAFDVDSTQAVAWALLFYALGLVGHAVVEIVTRAFYAMHDTRTPVLVGVAAMLANIALSIGLMSLFAALGWMPHGGLALANSLATTAETVVLVYIIRNQLGGLEGSRLALALGRMVVACGVMLIGLVAISRVLTAAPAWLVGGGGILVGGGIYGGVTLLLGSEEPIALMRRFQRRFR